MIELAVSAVMLLQSRRLHVRHALALTVSAQVEFKSKTWKKQLIIFQFRIADNEGAFNSGFVVHRPTSLQMASTRSLNRLP
jgi:hypothetical protein